MQKVQAGLLDTRRMQGRYQHSLRDVCEKALQRLLAESSANSMLDASIAPVATYVMHAHTPSLYRSAP